uniref:Agouti domain-containing protein n=1 Tax=Gasterosteus aculeatus aculeatus TaxID=481459 RepID=A0AAQ4RMI3_GASAC
YYYSEFPRCHRTGWDNENERKRFCFITICEEERCARGIHRRRRKRQRSAEVCSQVKTRGLFARKKIAAPQKSHTNKSQSSLMPPARRCGRLMGSCSTHVRCCDPCASCRCRLFNTICHCWRMNPLCLQKT